MYVKFFLIPIYKSFDKSHTKKMFDLCIWAVGLVLFLIMVTGMY